VPLAPLLLCPDAPLLDSPDDPDVPLDWPEVSDVPLVPLLLCPDAPPLDPLEVPLLEAPEALPPLRSD